MYKSITVFTPTYNRAYILERCYLSLKNQTYKDFTWLIVDDGSTDETEKIINKWKNEANIKIIYYKKNNGGKSSAHNLGVKKTETDLFVCVDSDDYLVETAIEKILKLWNEYGNNSSISGIVALKGHNANEPMKSYMPNNIKQAKLFHLYFKYGFKGETMLVYKTEILKQYMFPKIDGEKFVPEAYIYDKIDKSYDLILMNEVLYVCDYLEDGYSKNVKKIISENPKGYALFYRDRLEISDTFYMNFRSATLYIVGKLIAGEKDFIKKSPKKQFTFFAFPAAFFVYIFKYKLNILGR